MPGPSDSFSVSQYVDFIAYLVDTRCNGSGC
jgi:hypothetical protein